MAVPAVAETPPRPARPAHLKLYEATDELNAAYELLVESEGELTPEIEELLAHAQGTFEEKAERVALMVRTLAANQAAAKLEAERLSKLAASAERSAESLKAYLKREMERAGVQKVERPLAKVRIQANSAPSVTCALDVDGLRELQVKYPQIVRVIPEKLELDSRAFAAEVKRDPTFTVEGVTVERGTHLRIA